jgi:hypothetical protein
MPGTHVRELLAYTKPNNYRFNDRVASCFNFEVAKASILKDVTVPTVTSSVRSSTVRSPHVVIRRVLAQRAVSVGPVLHVKKRGNDTKN